MFCTSIAMSLGKPLGKFLANVQHTVDSAVTWGFERLEKSGKEPPKAPPPVTRVDKAKHLLRRGAGFVGEFGSSYYHEYEKLKQREKEQDTPRD